MEERITRLANAFVSGLKEPEIEALGVLMLDAIYGVGELTQAIVVALSGLQVSLQEQLDDIEECPDCKGESFKCKTCKGVGKFIPEMPHFAFSLYAEILFVKDILCGNVWKKHKELEVELGRALISCRD